MNFNPLYLATPQSVKRKRALSYAAKAPFLTDILHALIDYGLSIHFSPLQHTSAYTPFALSTEKLDSPAKQKQFKSGFLRLMEQKQLQAHIKLTSIHGESRVTHDLIHELMHIYQDMYGLYFVPLKEQDTMPNLLDMQSDIAAILLCECWAQIQTIRTCHTIKESTGDNLGWKGAVSHPDFSYLACEYEEYLQNGIEEQKAAAKIFRSWYNGKHRNFYERHAANIHKLNYLRLTGDIADIAKIDIQRHSRKLTIEKWLERIPENAMSGFFDDVDWNDSTYFSIQSQGITSHGQATNTQIQDIKCGAPLYIWNRLRAEEIDKFSVPAEMLEEAQRVQL